MTTEHEVEMTNQERLAKEATEAGFPCGGWVQDIRPGVDVFLPEIDATNGDYKFVTGTVIRVNTNTEFAYSFVLRIEDGTQIVLFHSGSWPCYFREPEMSPLLKNLIDWLERLKQNAPIKDDLMNTKFKKEGEEELFIKRHDLVDDDELIIKQFDHGGVIEHVDPELEKLLDEEELIEEGQAEELRRARLASEGVDRRKNILEHQMPDVD
jgi:hypothetical protein